MEGKPATGGGGPPIENRSVLQGGRLFAGPWIFLNCDCVTEARFDVQANARVDLAQITIAEEPERAVFRESNRIGAVTTRPAELLVTPLEEAAIVTRFAGCRLTRREEGERPK